MQFDEVFHDRQAQSKATEAARRRCIALTEALKHIGKKFGANTDTRILNHDFHVGVDALEDDVNATALGSELHCIRQ